MIVLWHSDAPIGTVVFGTPAASLALRSRYFGLKNPRTGLAMQSLNERLWLLQRVVLHPTYRGGGIASEFIRRACELCDVDWIETLSAMGRANPVFERAGFVRVGAVKRSGSANGAYGGRAKLSDETRSKSRFSEPVYYIFDNRHRRARLGPPSPLPLVPPTGTGV